jgi:hypothetical protein
MTGNMSGARVCLRLAAMAILGGLVAAPASANDRSDRSRERGAVVPCSLVGVNPAYHPEIFGNAAAAQSYGFVQTTDRTWHVRPDCRR